MGVSPLPTYKNGPAGRVDAAADIVKMLDASSKKAAKATRKASKKSKKK